MELQLLNFWSGKFPVIRNQGKFMQKRQAAPVIKDQLARYFMFLIMQLLLSGTQMWNISWAWLSSWFKLKGFLVSPVQDNIHHLLQAFYTQVSERPFLETYFFFFFG